MHDPQADHPEIIPLHLPSLVNFSGKANLRSIALKELQLRIAQADQLLAEIHCGRRILTGYTQFKKLNVTGTGNKPNTRMCSLYNQMQLRVDRAAERYRSAYAALHSLDQILAGTGDDWKDRFHPLSNNRGVQSWP